MSRSQRSMAGDILLLEDTPTEREDMQRYLQSLSSRLRIMVASNRKEAVEHLENHPCDVAILDMALKENPEGGYEMLLEIKNKYPAIEVIIATNYLKVDQAVRCMRAGCLDYGGKGNPEALGDRVRQALDLSRGSGRRTSLTELLIIANWDEVFKATDKQKKGWYLESLVGHLLRTIPGWSVSEREGTSTEEIDLVVLNESNDGFWRQRSSFILFECKNWGVEHRKPGRSEYDAFYCKLLRRTADYCRLGFFVSLNGVSKDFEKEASRSGGEGPVVVTVDSSALWAWICAEDRSRWLKDRIHDRVFG